MFILVISAFIVWNVVLAFFVLRDFRLLLKIIRWSTSLYLIVFGIFVAEVLREGLVVNGHFSLHWDVRLAWGVWYVLAGLSVVDWRFLVPAVGLPLWLFSYPEVRILLNYGLVRLGWANFMYSPLSWAASSPEALELALRTRIATSRVWTRMLLPALRPVKFLLDIAAGWFLRVVRLEANKLTPPPRWKWPSYTQ